MRYSKIIRRLLALSITFVTLGLGIMAPMYPVYLEVAKQLILPLTIVLGSYFTVEGIKNYKKKESNV